MKTLIIIALGAGLAAAVHVAAQEADEPRNGERPPPPPRGEERVEKSAPLTAAQAEQVKVILSKYDAATLTADQAKAIHESFRQAGLRGGPAMGEAIEAAGFDPDKLRDLAPPTGPNGEGVKRPTNRDAGAVPGGEQPPPPRGEERAAKNETLTAAQTEQVKVILSKYDTATLTADQAKAIHESFRQAGLRGGPAMGNAIKAAGFDPDKLRDLAPPPERARGKDQRPGERE